MLENANIAMKELLEMILVRAQKEKRGAVEQVSIFLKNTQLIMYRMLVGI